LVSLGCLIWAVRVLDWDAVADALADADYLWIALALLSVLLTVAVRVARWAALLHPRRVRLNSLLAAILVGQMLNYFAPARAGDLARAYLLGHTESESKMWALGTVALEKLWDIWVLLTLVGLLSFSAALPDWLVSPARWLTLIAFLMLILSLLTVIHRSRVIAWMAWLGRYLPPRVYVGLHSGFERLLDGLDGLRRPRVWFWAALWTAATWGMGALTNHTVLTGMGLSLPFSASLLLLVVLQMGVAVPSLPGRVGVFEGLSILVLALFDVDRNAAFAAGLVLHVVVFVPPILLGLYYSWRIKASNSRGVP
jgi:uncharacterized protein (TIRG00374 family)